MTDTQNRFYKEIEETVMRYAEKIEHTIDVLRDAEYIDPDKLGAEEILRTIKEMDVELGDFQAISSRDDNEELKIFYGAIADVRLKAEKTVDKIENAKRCGEKVALVDIEDFTRDIKRDVQSLETSLNRLEKEAEAVGKKIKQFYEFETDNVKFKQILANEAIYKNLEYIQAKNDMLEKLISESDKVRNKEIFDLKNDLLTINPDKINKDTHEKIFDYLKNIKEIESVKNIIDWIKEHDALSKNENQINTNYSVIKINLDKIKEASEEINKISKKIEQEEKENANKINNAFERDDDDGR